MRTSLLLLLPLFFFASVLNAQFKLLGEGKTFAEETTGAEKIIQLKNGNTVFIYLEVSRSYKFFFQLYDRSHKKIHESNAALSDLNKDFSIQSAFEVNGDVMLILGYYEKYNLILHRILVDGTSGLVKENKQFSDAGMPTPPAMWEEAFAGFPPDRIYVINNGSANGYSVVILRNASEKNNIEVIKFDQQHKEIKNITFPAPDLSYKYMYLADATGIDNNTIAALCYPYNTRSSGGKGHELILYTLNLETNEKAVYRFPSSSEELIAHGVMRYNQTTNQLLTLFVTEKKKFSGDYTAHISSLSLANKKILYTKEIFPTAAVEKSKELFSKKKNKINSPLNLLVNKDGSFSVVYEDIDYPYDGASGSAQYTASLGNIAIQKFDKDGPEKGSFLVAKSQNINKTSISLHYQKRSEGNVFMLDNGKQFKYFSFLQGQQNNYILLNDSPDNSRSAENGKITTVSGIGEAEAYYVSLSAASGITPTRKNVFASPNSVALFAISDYDAINNVFVTLRLIKGGKDNGVSLVWLQPE